VHTASDGVSESERIPLAFFDSIAKQSGGFSRIVRSVPHRPISTYLQLMEAFSNTLQGETRVQSSRIVHKEILSMSEYTSSTGSFTVESLLGKNVRFGLFVESAEDHLVKSVRFRDNKGTKYGPFYSMSSLYDIINFKVINYPIGGVPPFDEVCYSAVNVIFTLSISFHTAGSHIRNWNMGVGLLSAKSRQSILEVNFRVNSLCQFVLF
jgi:hypothetical protein